MGRGTGGLTFGDDEVSEVIVGFVGRRVDDGHASDCGYAHGIVARGVGRVDRGHWGPVYCRLLHGGLRKRATLAGQ